MASPPPIAPDTPDPTPGLSEAELRFERWRKTFGVIFTPLAFALAWWWFDGLPPQGRTLAAILSAVGVLWVSEVVPLPVGALLGAVACVVLGVGDARKVFGYFADPIVFVFIGSFMLAQAMHVHGLDRRIALSLLSLPAIGRSPAGMLGGIGLVTALLSMWVSNTATTAMMLPIALGVLGALHASRGVGGALDARAWPFATGMMLMVAYGASIGGIGTPVGSPPNLIGIGLIRTNAGVEISFFTWMALCVPLLVVMGAALFVLMWWLHRGTAPPAGGGAAGMRAFLLAERQKLGRWTPGQRNALIAFSVAVALWVLPGVLALPGLAGSDAEKWVRARLPESVVAVAAAALLFVLPVKLREGKFTLTWEQASRIDWGTILLFGGGLAMGNLMSDTGVAAALGESLKSWLGPDRSVWVLTGAAIAAAILLSEATSNTTAANMLIPVVIGIAKASEMNPVPPALGACLGASFGFMLPVSTPPNAIVYGSGLVPLGRMIRAGVFFDVIGFVLIWAGLRVMCPLLGLG